MIKLLRETRIEDRSGGRVSGGVVREKTLGVVDIGSNTVHLLVARTNGRSITPLLDMSEGLRLGGAVDYNGTLSPEKLDELISTLREFQTAAAEVGVGVTNLHLLATQAIRTALNRDQICDAIEIGPGVAPGSAFDRQ